MDHLLARVAKSALHDTSTRPNDYTSECHPNTRKLLLKQLLESNIFLKHLIQWFWGPAGAGKTAIMRSFAKELVGKGNFLAGFYFWRSDYARNNLKAFFPTLAQQLAENDPTTAPFIEKALLEDKLLLDRSYATQMEKLIIKPLLAAHHDHPDQPHPRLIIIDGLDECDSEGQHEFLETLLPTLAYNLSRIRITIFVSSRPEQAIDNGFSHPRLMGITNRTFLEPSKEDVRQFLKDEFDEINRCHKGLTTEEGGKWPRESDLGILEDKSSGYFILVATAMRHIKPSGNLRGRTPVRRLREVLEVLRVDALAPLDALYLYILRQNAPEDPTELAEWKETVGLICIPVQSKFSTWTGAFGDDAFHVLYGKSRTEVEQIVRDLGSIFYVDSDGRPRNHHASFPDCLFNPERSAEFTIDPRLLHERIACAIIGSLNWVHISDEDDTFNYNSLTSKVGRYSVILDDGLLPHVELSPKIVAGGRFETAIADLHFGQLLSLSQKSSSTFALAAVIWKRFLSLFNHPAFEPLSHCREPVTLRLRAFFYHFLDGLQPEDPFDYASLMDWLSYFLGDWLSYTPVLKGGHLRWVAWESRSSLMIEDLITENINIAVRETSADLGLPMFKCLSRFFNGDFAHHYPSLFLREVAPVVGPHSLEIERGSYRTVLILYSAPDQAMLNRLWDLSISPGFDGLFMGPKLSNYVRYPSSPMLAASLQYFNLCKQAGIRPEGLLVDLEARWLSLSSVAIVPPGHVTILDSFPEPRPGSLVAKWLAEDPSLSVYFPTLGKSKPTPSLIPGPSPADATTSSNEPLTGLDTQLLVETPSSTASAADHLIFGEELLEPVTLADIDRTVTISGCETVATSNEILKAADCSAKDPSQPISSPTIPSTANPLIDDPVPLSEEHLAVTGETDRDSVFGSDVIIEVVGAKRSRSQPFITFMKSIPMRVVALSLGLAMGKRRRREIRSKT